MCTRVPSYSPLLRDCGKIPEKNICFEAEALHKPRVLHHVQSTEKSAENNKREKHSERTSPHQVTAILINLKRYRTYLS
jgi:hypothetical protein